MRHPGIYKFISQFSFFLTFSTGYFRKQQNETSYFCGIYKVDRLLTGLNAQQKGTTARWYSNKT